MLSDSSSPRIRVVCLVARKGGLHLLRRLSSEPRFEVVVAFTHAKKATFEDPMRSLRPDFAEFQALADERGFPLRSIDSVSGARNLAAEIAAFGAVDLLVSLSWRYLVRGDALRLPRIAAVNLHRGELPKYGGAFPVERALRDGADRAVITAHIMTEEIDAGRVLVERPHPIGLRPGEAVLDAVDRIKAELDPFYPDVAMEAIEVALAEAADAATRGGVGSTQTGTTHLGGDP